jgi:hypothetical protein
MNIAQRPAERGSLPEFSQAVRTIGSRS